MDDTCKVRGTEALAVHVSRWLRDEEAEFDEAVELAPLPS